MLLCLLIDDSFERLFNHVWDIYFSLYVTEEALEILEQEAIELIALAHDPQTWRSGKYGHIIQFCDAETLKSVKKIWESYCVSTQSPSERKGRQIRFEASIKSSQRFREDKSGKPIIVTTSWRSMAPLLNSTTLSASDEDFFQRPHDDHSKDLPNPMFQPSKDSTTLIHYGTNPLLGFHLALAFASLDTTSPLRPESASSDTRSATVQAAQTQFRAWSAAFKKCVQHAKIAIRVFQGDALAFGYVLQSLNDGPRIENNTLYKDPYRMTPIYLDDHLYGHDGAAPTLFNVIDTSNLADHLGTVNILTVASLLLQVEPHSSIQTENLVKADANMENMTKRILCGDFSTVSALLKLFPVEFWTNTSACAPQEAMLSSVLPEMGQMHCRLLWKTIPSEWMTKVVTKLHYESSQLAELLYKVYLRMFENEDVRQKFAQLRMDNATQALANLSLLRYHRWSFALFLKCVRSNVNTDWEHTMSNLLTLVENDENLLTGRNYLQELYAAIHMMGLYSVDSIQSPKDMFVSPLTNNRLFERKDLPGLLQITLIVPRSNLALFTSLKDKRQLGTPTVRCLISNRGRNVQNNFAGVSLCFGTARTHGQRNTSEFSVTVEEDTSGWLGESPLVVSFWVSAFTLLQDGLSGRIAFGLQSTPQATVQYVHKLGLELKVYETNLDDVEHVYISDLPPNSITPRFGHQSLVEDKTLQGRDDDVISIRANTDAVSSLTSITHRIDLKRPSSLAVLRTGAKVKIVSTNAFQGSLIIGDGPNEVKYTMTHPFPVNYGTCRFKVARTSGYVEATLRPADPRIYINASSMVMKLIHNGSPVIWNMPHVDLKKLPILDTKQKDKTAWLITHTSIMWSARERKIREANLHRDFGGDPKLSFKESLFSIFMQYAGLQGTRSSLFCLHDASQGGGETLICPQSLKLDVANHSVVLDCIVIPVNRALVRTSLFRRVIENI